MLLAKRIRQIRENYNLTQAEVAFRCDITPSAYGQIERKASKCTYETLSKIAHALGVSLTFLIDIESDLYREENNKL